MKETAPEMLPICLLTLTTTDETPTPGIALAFMHDSPRHSLALEADPILIDDVTSRCPNASPKIVILLWPVVGLFKETADDREGAANDSKVVLDPSCVFTETVIVNEPPTPK